MSEIISENNDLNGINWVAGLSDPGEMIGCGYLPQIRRQAGEQDAEYQARITPIVMALPQEQRDRIMGAAIKRANLDASTGKVAAAVALVEGDPNSVPAWHRLGKLLRGLQKSGEMIEAAVLNWPVKKEQLYLANGQPFPGAFGLVRGDTGAALNAVGSDYTALQNAEAFAFMDALVGEGLAVYETAGALDGGKRIWIMARIPKELRVGKEDVVTPYALLSNRHGYGSIKMFATSVRVACQNSLNMAMKGAADGGLSIRHTKNVKAAVEEARQKLGLIVKRVDIFQSQLDALARFSLKDSQVADYLERLYPTGRKVAPRPGLVIGEGNLLDNILAAREQSGEVMQELLVAAEEEKSRQHKRNEKILEQILANYHGEKCNLPGIEGPAWGLYNAVSEYVDHQSTVRGKDDTAKANSRMKSIFFGAGADKKQAAFSLALEMAGAARSITVKPEVGVSATGGHPRLLRRVLVTPLDEAQEGAQPVGLGRQLGEPLADLLGRWQCLDWVRAHGPLAVRVRAGRRLVRRHRHNSTRPRRWLCDFPM